MAETKPKGIWFDDMIPDYSKSIEENQEIEEERDRKIEKFNSMSWKEIEKLNKEK